MNLLIFSKKLLMGMENNSKNLQSPPPRPPPLFIRLHRVVRYSYAMFGMYIVHERN